MSEIIVNVTKGDLQEINPIHVKDIFSDKDKMALIIEHVKDSVKDVHRDVSNDVTRGYIKSIAYKVARSKTYIDDLGKNYASDLKEKVKKIDSIRKYARDELDQLKDKVRKPVTEWENIRQGFDDDIQGFKDIANEFHDSIDIVDELLSYLESKSSVDVVDDKKDDFESARLYALSRLSAQRENLIKAAEAEEKRKEEEENRRKEEIEAAKQKAIEDERIRAAREKDETERRKRVEEENRINDDNHREKVESEIISAFGEFAQLGPLSANIVLKAIRNNKIPHISVRY